jgi:hypothetical protein
MVGSHGARRRAAWRRSGRDRRRDQDGSNSPGAVPTELGRSLACGAALRVARFGDANEHGDWETAHHVFTHANALHRMLERIGFSATDGIVSAVRGILRGASRAKTASDSTTCLSDEKTLRDALLDAFDRQRQVDLAARLVARHLTLGHSPQVLITTLAHAMLREDAGFHAYQMLEAGVRQFSIWANSDEGRRILVAVARYLAAHSPTERAAQQTADLARRLMRGGELHQSADAS